MANAQEPPPTYEFVTQEQLLKEEPPPYEACLTTSECGAESIPYSHGISTDTAIFQAEYDGAHIQPERMLWVSLLTTLVCLLWCSWPCSISAFYLASKGVKAKSKGEQSKTRTFVYYAIMLNVLSLAFGLITLSTAIVASVLGLPQVH